MIKLRNLKRKKGFTLSELIIVIVIIGILLAAVASFGDPVRSMVNDTTAKSDTINISKIMGDYIERRLSFADNVCIISNVNAGATGDTNVEAQFKSFKESGKTTIGMLVFKYQENTTDSLKSTYKLYDIPIKNDDDHTYDKSFTTVSGKKVPNNPVFADAFYSKYSYFITAEPYMVDAGTPGKYKEDIKLNTLKDTPYLEFSVRAYDFKGSNYIDNTILSKYHAALKDSGVTDNGIDAFKMERVAQENVSFSLENVRVTRIPGTGKPVQGGISYVTPTVSGSDTIVFYSVNEY